VRAADLQFPEGTKFYDKEDAPFALTPDRKARSYFGGIPGPVRDRLYLREASSISREEFNSLVDKSCVALLERAANELPARMKLPIERVTRLLAAYDVEAWEPFFALPSTLAAHVRAEYAYDPGSESDPEATPDSLEANELAGEDAGLHSDASAAWRSFTVDQRTTLVNVLISIDPNNVDTHDMDLLFG
jgi:hypothetical protein